MFSASRVIPDWWSFTTYGAVVVEDFDGDGAQDVVATEFGYEDQLQWFDLDLRDSDGDGLTASTEVCMLGTLPDTADTDGGGRSDGLELLLGTDPLLPGDD